MANLGLAPWAEAHGYLQLSLRDMSARRRPARCFEKGKTGMLPSVRRLFPADLLQSRRQGRDLHVERSQRLTGALGANIFAETERRRRVKAAKHETIRAVG